MRSNAVVLASGYARLPPARQQRALDIGRRYVADATGEQRDWRLALASAQLAVVAHRELTGGQAGTPGAMAGSTLMTGLANRQMQQNMWAMRHPECGVVGSHPSSCSRDAPIMHPLTPY